MININFIYITDELRHALRELARTHGFLINCKLVFYHNANSTILTLYTFVITYFHIQILLKVLKNYRRQKVNLLQQKSLRITLRTIYLHCARVLRHNGKSTIIIQCQVRLFTQPLPLL